MFTISTPLWKHQREMIDFAKGELRSTGYAWWIAGCAVGKTLASLALASELHVPKILVLTTKAAIDDAWETNILEHTEGLTPVPLLKGNSKQKAHRMLDAVRDTNTPTAVIVNYETANLIAPNITRAGFQMVIADESHKLKSYDSQMSNKLAWACRHIPYKLPMTGTAWDDRPTDCYGQVRWLAPVSGNKYYQSRILGRWNEFFERYVSYYIQDNIKIPSGYKNQQELRRRLDPFTVYVDSEEVLTLPPEIDITRMVKMTGKLKKAYRDLEDEMIAQIGEDILIADNKLVLSLRLHQLTGGFYQPLNSEEIHDLGDTAKLDMLLTILDEIGGKPTVVFTRFREDVQRISTALRKIGVTYNRLVGGAHEHAAWKAGKSQVLIANMAAGSAAVNLSRARYCVYYSTGHSRTHYSQSRYRVRRPTSDGNKPIVYYHILMENSVDIEIRTALEGKGRVSDCLLQGLVNRVKSSANG